MTDVAGHGPEMPSDAVLIAAVRCGDTEAYGLLYERHLAAAKRAAAYLVSTSTEREDLVAEAFTRVLQALRAGRGPDQDFRPYLLVTMRNAVANAASRAHPTSLYADVPDSFLPSVTDEAIAAPLGSDATSAFTGLPERWRVVLWHTEVEGASPAEIAPMLGMTPNGVAALAYRAREGLRRAYLRMHPPSTDRHPTEKLVAHLARCARCRALAASLPDSNSPHGALAAVVPITFGGSVMSWLSTAKSAVSAATAKTGVAAAITAIATVTVVASGPVDGPESATAMPWLPHVTKNVTETQVRSSAANPDRPPVSAAPIATARVSEAEPSGDKGAVKNEPRNEPKDGNMAKAGKAAKKKGPVRGQIGKNSPIRESQATTLRLFAPVTQRHPG